MKVLIANQDLVSDLLPMQECIGAMREALRSLARGEAILPLRMSLILPDEQSLMAVMPAYLGGGVASVGVKTITAFPKNFGTEYDSHQGLVLLFDAERGFLRAIVDATAVTAIRTAAVSGVATALLAREDAADLAIIGAGTQARAHLEAMLCVRKLARVRVYSLPLDGAYRFAEKESKRHGIQVEVAEDARAAVTGADIICTVTTAKEPVLHGEWLSPGAHINAIGAYTPTTRELDSEAVRQARLFVDRRESTLKEAGDFLIPRQEGIIGDDHIRAEIGQLLLDQAVGRTSPDDITLFKSLGIAIEDLAAAHYVLQKAQERNHGTWVELGGRHYGSD